MAIKEATISIANPAENTWIYHGGGFRPQLSDSFREHQELQLTMKGLTALMN